MLVGRDGALLEGLAQSLAALGYRPRVAFGLAEARETSARDLPLVAVVERALADESHEVLGIPLDRGGALVLYRKVGSPATPLVPAVQRVVLADLTLPLERNRLVALLQHVQDRARVTGRSHQERPPESRAI